jgi:GT2 family glycosyltransferase
MSAPLVISVILNTNRREDTLACLASLAANSYQPQITLVLDNASTDGSVEAIRAAYPQTQVLSLTENRGYAGNNNVGIAWAMEHGADWVLVLNEDTILAPDCLATLVAAGSADPRAGMLGPMVYYYDQPQVIQSAGGMLGPRWLSIHRGQHEVDHGQFATVQSVEWLSGCALAVRRAVIEQVGMIDERFFIYWEEVDWCTQARRAGWSLLHVPAAKIWHKGVQSDYRPSPGITYYMTRNWFLFMSKNHAPLSARLYAAGTTLRTLSSWTLKPKWRNMRAHRDAMLHGLLDFARRRWGMRPQ